MFDQKLRFFSPRARPQLFLYWLRSRLWKVFDIGQPKMDLVKLYQRGDLLEISVNQN